MRVETLFTPSEITEAAVKDRVVVVIDVLRACTTIAFAMSRRCERIIPVASVEAAMNLASSLEKKVTLLGGEREGKRIDGFDLGNSPLEYTEDVVKGKAVVLATTNGTRAMSMSQGAKEILVASFVNMASVVERASGLGKETLTVVCAGESGKFSLEDAVCAGMLIDRLGETNAVDLNDGAQAARSLYLQNQNSIADLLKQCEHGRYLEGLGFAKDLDICSRVDSLNILPVVKEGRIVKPKRSKRK